MTLIPAGTWRQGVLPWRRNLEGGHHNFELAKNYASQVQKKKMEKGKKDKKRNESDGASRR